MSDPTRPLSPAEAADLLRSLGEAIRLEVLTLPADVTVWRPGPAEWSVCETLGHVIEAERRGFAGRIREILASSSDPEIIAWDQKAVAAERNDRARGAAALVAEFAARRASSLELVRGLSAADLTRACHHSWAGYLSVRELIHEWVHHDRNHLKQIYSNVQAYVFPTMGNTRKFTTE